VTSAPTFTLKEVSGIIQSKIELQFPSSFWVRAEISKLGYNPHSQHAYPELVEKENGKIVAQMSATLFARTFQSINTQFLRVLNEPLKDGINALLHVKIQFSPLYGLSLNVIDIDPSYTLGELERERLETIKKLKEEGIFDRNKSLVLPLLIQRIAIISGEGTQGFSDFMSVLENNEFGYAFYTHVFSAVMQGDAAVASIRAQLQRIEKVKKHFDAVLIIRGGGGNVGMTCYNNYQLSKSIALFPLPVYTGIGHSTNEFVADLVAAKSSITPTGIATFLVDRMREIEKPLLHAQEFLLREVPERLSAERKLWSDYAQNLRSLTRLEMNRHRESQERWVQKMIFRINKNIAKEQVAHENILGTLNNATRNRIKEQQAIVLENQNKLRRNTKQIQNVQAQKLDTIADTLRLLDPQQLLKRGYSITSNENGVIRSAAQMKPGDRIITQLVDGSFTSTINE
jgi:exodeoxyribonuclease VII large subunit